MSLIIEPEQFFPAHKTLLLSFYQIFYCTKIQCSNITPDFRSMSGYRTFLSWYVRKASGFTLKVLKLSDNRSWVLIYVCAVIAKVLRWFELGNLQLSEHSDVLPTAYYEMFM